MTESITRWGAMWVQKRPGEEEFNHFLYQNGSPVMFHTREEARKYIKDEYGYIKTRKDLRGHPHFWRLPKPVKIEIRLQEA